MCGAWHTANLSLDFLFLSGWNNSLQCPPLSPSLISRAGPCKVLQLQGKVDSEYP